MIFFSSVAVRRTSLGRATGYTLIEILIVLFILSIAAAIAVMSLGQSAHKRYETFAKELTQLITLAQEQALLQPAVLGLRIQGHHMQFMIYQKHATENRMVWKIFDDPILHPRAIPNTIQIQLQVGNRKPDAEESEQTEEERVPQIIFSINGDMTPFKLGIGPVNAEARYLIEGEMNGDLHIESLP